MSKVQLRETKETLRTPPPARSSSSCSSLTLVSLLDNQFLSNLPAEGAMELLAERVMAMHPMNVAEQLLEYKNRSDKKNDELLDENMALRAAVKEGFHICHDENCGAREFLRSKALDKDLDSSMYAAGGCGVGVYKLPEAEV